MIEVARLSRWPSAATVATMLLLLAVSACSRPSSTGGYPDFADLVERASPSVVNISTISAGARHRRDAAGHAERARMVPPLSRAERRQRDSRQLH
jgi:S1-C subfamily serine protease